MRKWIFMVGCFSLSFAASTPRVHAWGHTGHMVVSQIAYSNLTATARARVEQLIAVRTFFLSPRSGERIEERGD